MGISSNKLSIDADYKKLIDEIYSGAEVELLYGRNQIKNYTEFKLVFFIIYLISGFLLRFALLRCNCNIHKNYIYIVSACAELNM